MAAASDAPVARAARRRDPRPSFAALPVDLNSLYIETRFSRELVSWMERTLEERVYRLITASSGCGKTKASQYFSRVLHPPYRTETRLVRPALNFVFARERRRQGAGMRERIAASMGAVVDVRTQRSAVWIARQMAGTHLLMGTDAHRMTPDEHLPALQEITDLYEEFNGEELGLLLLASTTRGRSVVQEAIEGGDDAEWAQIRARFAPERPFVSLRGMSEGDVREALAGYESGLQDHFPKVDLVPWTRDVYGYLKRPRLAPDGVSHVPMRSVRRFVEALLRRLVARGLDTVSEDLIHEVGLALVTGQEPEASSMREPLALTESDG
jgi:hypothetical protein